MNWKRKADDGDDVASFREVLEQQRELEEEAAAKLLEDWGDESSCTYDKGYIKQPVYACATCSSSANVQFGVCFGCSMNCHVQHEIYELFEKRHFKCDCGTPKTGRKCQLSSTSSEHTDNEENKYSHNFDGKYCSCNKEYKEDVDVMLRCVVCEDWFHEHCIQLSTQVPDHRQFNDFVCLECTKHCKFLEKYSHLRVFRPPIQANQTALLEPQTNTVTVNNSSNNTTSTTTATNNPSDNNYSTNTDLNNNNISSGDTDVKKTNSCKMLQTPEAAEPSVPYPAHSFWKPQWKKELCGCDNCAQLYKQLAVSFLIQEPEIKEEEEEEEEDEGEEETNGEIAPTTSTTQDRKRPFVSLIEYGEKVFLEDQSIDHASKLNIIEGYNDLAAELKTFLKDFAEQGKTVTREDVDNFFEELRRKRQRRT